MNKIYEIKEGDTVIRVMGGVVRMPLTVQKVDESKIYCGAWTFDKSTGDELDEEIGWYAGHSGSYIIIKY